MCCCLELILTSVFNASSIKKAGEISMVFEMNINDYKAMWFIYQMGKKRQIPEEVWQA